MNNDHEAVQVRHAADDVELEQPEHLPHRHAAQAVDAAGDERRLVGGFEQQQRDAERHHQPRKVLAAHDEKAGQPADQRRHRARDQQAAERFAPTKHGEQSRRVRADAEVRRMAERNDAGVTEDQVERHREQADDHDLAAKHEVTGKRKKRRDQDQPEHDLARAPALDGQPMRMRRRNAAGGAAGAFA